MISSGASAAQRAPAAGLFGRRPARRHSRVQCAAVAQWGVRLAGCGSSVPETFLTNQDLEKLVDTTDEWITTRTGNCNLSSASKSARAPCQGLPGRLCSWRPVARAAVLCRHQEAAHPGAGRDLVGPLRQGLAGCPGDGGCVWGDGRGRLLPGISRAAVQAGRSTAK